MTTEDKTTNQTDSGDSGSATITAPTKNPSKTVRKPKQLPRYKLLLHNDEENTFEHVIRSIIRLTPIPETEAIVRATEAHETGVSLLLVTHRERAELYMDQFSTMTVTTTIEPE